MRIFLAAGLGFWLVFPLSAQGQGPAQDKREASYQGRPLSYWIGALRQNEKNDPALRRRIMAALQAIGEPAVPALVEVLGDKDAWARGGAAAAHCLIRPQAPEAIQALARALEDEDDLVRRFAARALQEIGPPAKAAVPALVRAMQSGQLLLNGYAADALRKIDPAVAAKGGVQ